MKKTFVIDTNVILSNPNCVFNFEEHDIIIPLAVITELDNFKKGADELGRNARHFSNTLDEFREKGKITEGVQISNKGGKISVSHCSGMMLAKLPDDLNKELNDSKILAVAKHFDAILVSKDTNIRIIADSLNIITENYKNERIDVDDLFTGRVQIEGELSHFQEPFTNISEKLTDIELYPNQFIEVIEEHFDTNDTQICRYIKETKTEPEQVFPIRKDLESWGLKPKNNEQEMALDLILDDNIKLVSIIGPAGCGKTILALAGALRLVTDEFKYRKILVSRPVMPMGKDIGYLPGDINEKLAPYMQPIYDNIEFLMSGYTADSYVKNKKRKSKKEVFENEKDVGGLGSGYLELQQVGIIQIEPLLYIRGRSIPNQILLVDEAQQLSRHELRTILTRAGEGTKIILTGDIEQIDTPYLDATSCGLTYVVNQFKDQSIAGHVTLTKCERSELAEISSKIL